MLNGPGPEVSDRRIFILLVCVSLDECFCLISSFFHHAQLVTHHNLSFMTLHIILGDTAVMVLNIYSRIKKSKSSPEPTEWDSDLALIFHEMPQPGSALCSHISSIPSRLTSKKVLWSYSAGQNNCFHLCSIDPCCTFPLSSPPTPIRGRCL
jgi:hypothetical protein